MPKPPTTTTAHRRSLDTHGQTVDLTNYESDTSERVETWTATTSSPHSITARVDLRETPRVVDTVRESGDADIDARIYVADDASGVSSIRDGGGKGASTVDVDQDGSVDFRVIVSHDEDNGLLRLDAERID